MLASFPSTCTVVELYTQEASLNVLFKAHHTCVTNSDSIRIVICQAHYPRIQSECPQNVSK